MSKPVARKKTRRQNTVCSKGLAWKKLEGVCAGSDLMSTFAAFKKQEREREDSRS